MFHSIYEVDKVIVEDVEGALIVGIIAHLHAIEALADRTPKIHTNMWRVLKIHEHDFEKPNGLPLSRGEHDHSIPLIPGSQPPNVKPYRHSFSQEWNWKDSSWFTRGTSYTYQHFTIYIPNCYVFKVIKGLEDVSWFSFPK